MGPQAAPRRARARTRQRCSASSSSRAPATSATRCSPAAGSATRGSSGTRRPTSTTSTWSSCPAASPTATTCGPERSRASRRRWRRWRGTPRPASPVLGICNGFQVLCEAGLLPGRAAAQRLASVRLPAGRAGGRERRDAVHGRVPARATGSRSRSSTESGRYFAPPEQLDELEARGGVVLRYAPGENPNGSAREIAGDRQRARQRDGTDAPSRARGRPAHRVARTGCGSSAPWPRRQPSDRRAPLQRASRQLSSASSSSTGALSVGQLAAALRARSAGGRTPRRAGSGRRPAR